MSHLMFIDTSYITALFNVRDKFHDRALKASATLAARKQASASITTEAVLMEIGNAFARLSLRSQGVGILRFMREDPSLEIVSVDHMLFGKALALYAARDDKEWGLIDCISFVLMQDRRITDALTTDKHFEQAGFRLLL